MFTTVLPVAAIDLDSNSLSATWKPTDARPLFVRIGPKWQYYGDYVAVALSTIPHTAWELTEFNFVRCIVQAAYDPH